MLFGCDCCYHVIARLKEPLQSVVRFIILKYLFVLFLFLPISIRAEETSAFIQETEGSFFDLKTEYRKNHDTQRSFEKALELEFQLLAFYVLCKESWNDKVENLSHRIQMNSLSLEQKLSDDSFVNYNRLTTAKLIFSFFILGYYPQESGLLDAKDFWNFLLSRSSLEEEALRRKSFIFLKPMIVQSKVLGALFCDFLENLDVNHTPSQLDQELKWLNEIQDFFQKNIGRRRHLTQKLITHVYAHYIVYEDIVKKIEDRLSQNTLRAHYSDSNDVLVDVLTLRLYALVSSQVMIGSLEEHRKTSDLDDVYVLLVKKNFDIFRDYEVDRLLFDYRRKQIEGDPQFYDELRMIDYLSRQLDTTSQLYWPGFMTKLYNKILGIDPLFETPDELEK
ncbi:MAG: hypothetical protein HYS98_00855 [Deltaproteobacteria bacterium]|nr:hypothetical protein [Deltaproteobacteria bacterium]